MRVRSKQFIGRYEMYIVLQKDDFITDKKGTSLFYYVLQSLYVPMYERDDITQLEIEVKSFKANRKV